MAQKYSISFKAGNVSKKNEIKIYIRIVTGGKEIKIPTSVKVNKKCFNGSKVTGTPLAPQLNSILDKELFEVKNKINDAILNNIEISSALFNAEMPARRAFKDFVENHIELNEKRFSRGRIRQLRSTLALILSHYPNIDFNDINAIFLQEFEKKISEEIIDKTGKHRESSTIRGIMTRFLSFIHAAERQGLVERKNFVYYKRPAEKRKIPVYLTEKEMQDFQKYIEILRNEIKKNTGYYFLLSCYTGFRISDCKAFDYADRVKDNLITIRAKKNKEIVSIPIYKKLLPILEYCKTHVFIEAEQHARKSVKEICRDIGMKNYLQVKFHSGRHSFAMYCLSKGMTKDEVAELLGDSRDVVEVYARIINPQLHKSVLSKLK